MEPQNVDLMIFMGQSNMAGRGEAASEAVCPTQAGAEFRAVSAPDRLFPISEPFGAAENRRGGIDDGARKTGSMISAFVAEYYRQTGRFTVAVSASQGGTHSRQWAEALVCDAAGRLDTAKSFLLKNEYRIGQVNMVWCQGETDGDLGVCAADYRKNFLHIWDVMRAHGTQRCLLIAIGNFNYPRYPEGNGIKSGAELARAYRVIHDAQQRLCAEREDLVLAADFSGHLSQMKDPFHYHQQAYHEVGRQAACAAAKFIAAV